MCALLLLFTTAEETQLGCLFGSKACELSLYFFSLVIRDFCLPFFFLSLLYLHEFNAKMYEEPMLCFVVFWMLPIQMDQFSSVVYIAKSCII